jgi:hypothetical protein
MPSISVSGICSGKILESRLFVRELGSGAHDDVGSFRVAEKEASVVCSPFQNLALNGEYSELTDVRSVTSDTDDRHILV